MERVSVIVTGTDPAACAGGIGFVLPGYLRALAIAGVPYRSIPTYDPSGYFGKFFLWIGALPKIIAEIRRIIRRGCHPAICSHAGSGISLVREFFVSLVGRMTGAQIVLHLHSPQIIDYLANPCCACLFKFSLAPAHVLVALTPWWKEFLQQSGVRKKIEVVPNPLTMELASIAVSETPRRRKRSGQITILTMARLVAGKGVGTVISAVNYLPLSWRVVIAGDGRLKNNLIRQARLIDSGGDRIIFTGWVRGREKSKLFEEADIFCLPSANDVFPMSFVEAMAHGLPVVGLKYAGIMDIVQDGKAGLLIDRPDSKLLAETLLRLSSGKVRSKMGGEARQSIYRLSSAASVGNRLREVLANLVQANARA